MKILSKYNFHKSGCFIQTKKGILDYFPDPLFIDCLHPKVYVWLEKGIESEIIYVGKTQFTIQRRLHQHKQGFKGKKNNGSNSGSKKHNYLLGALNNGYDVEIWTRQAEIRELIINYNILSEISHYSVEEEFFIKEFNPKLNFKNLLKQL